MPNLTEGRLHQQQRGLGKSPWKFSFKNLPTQGAFEPTEPICLLSHPQLMPQAYQLDPAALGAE